MCIRDSTSSDSKNTIESQTQENSESQATNDVEDASNVEENTNEVTTEEESSTPQAQIEKTIRQRIGDEYTYTDIDSITINENLGTEDVEGDYIALVNVTWTQMNKGPTSKKMLSMYSEDLAAYIGEECPNVQEIAIFWTVPYLDNANAKCAYERKGEGMYEMDMMWDNAFN